MTRDFDAATPEEEIAAWVSGGAPAEALLALLPEQHPLYAGRSATGKYRATPLRGLWQHPPYFHDGSAPDLPAVVNHYDQQLGLGLSDEQKADLVEFLKSL